VIRELTAGVAIRRLSGAFRLRLIRLTAGGLLGSLAALIASAHAFAQEAGAEAPAVGGGVADYGTGDWLNLVLRLSLVLLVIWLSIAAMRWWMRRMSGAAGRGPGRVLEVLESRSLGPNRSLQLVKLGNRAVLLGVTTERINAVLEVTDPIEVERLAARPEAAEPTSFRDAITRLGSLTRRTPERAGETTMSQSETQIAPVTVPAGGVTASGVPVQQPSAGRTSVAATAPRRARWMRMLRWVAGLQNGQSQRTDPRLAMQAAPPIGTGRAPITGVPPRSASTALGTAARMSPAERATLAAELPASRVSRARSGYRQNQIAEAQRAINAVRELRSG
jgi:flagellar protein FliO/FliZ